MIRYIYDGFLPSYVADNIESMGRRYPYAVEVSAMPEHARFQAVFADRTHRVNGEDCMGQATSSVRDGIAYGFVRRDFYSDGVTEGFLFLPDLGAHKTVVAMFPELVVNPSPFKTLIGD